MLFSGGGPRKSAKAKAFVSFLVALAVFVGVFFFAGALSGPETSADDGDRSYSITKVLQDVTVEPDGSMRVVESRTFDFDGSFNGVYWNIPQGTNSYNGKNVEVKVESAAVAQGDGVSAQASTAATPLSASEQGGEGSYTVQDDVNSNTNTNVKQVKLYHRASDSKVTFTLTYTISGVVTRWSDTAELYWKYVSDGWDAASQNVTSTIHLPAQATNPRAWGHGALDGSLTVEGSTVTYHSPVVGGADYAEARILFSADAVPNLAAQTPAADKTDEIVAQEQKWADEANAKRAAAQAGLVMLAFAGVGAGVLGLVLIRLLWRHWQKGHQTIFTDTYFRDVPSSDDVALLANLYWRNGLRPENLTCQLMDLTVKKRIALQQLPEEDHGFFDGLIGKKEPKWELVKLAEGTTPIERKAMELAFLNAHEQSDGRLHVALDEMANGNKEKSAKLFERWHTLLDSQVEERFRDSGSERMGGYTLIGLLGLMALGAAALTGVLSGSQLNLWVVAVLAAWVFALFVAVFVGCLTTEAMVDLNPEGMELKVKLDALRSWLLDFTRLDEAVPQDLVLWDRLLVMAVALGVSEEVLEQLKVSFPEVFADGAMPANYPLYSYLWLASGPNYGSSPLHQANSSSSHYVAVAAGAAMSSSSSGSGFGGGGFSGGGGGGFGGGGGGGAF